MGVGDGPGEEGVKGGASPTNAHTLLTQTWSHAFSWHLMRGAVWGPGPAPASLQALMPGFGRSRTLLSQLTAQEPPLLRAHGPWRARTHLGHSHSASRDIRPRTCPPFTHAHARVHTHARTHKYTHRPLPNSIPTPTRSPAKALIDCDTPTLIHRHTHSPTRSNYRHIHKQGQEKYTRTRSPSLLFREP